MAVSHLTLPGSSSPSNPNTLSMFGWRCLLNYATALGCSQENIANYDKFWNGTVFHMVGKDFVLRFHSSTGQSFMMLDMKLLTMIAHGWFVMKTADVGTSFTSASRMTYGWVHFVTTSCYVTSSRFRWNPLPQKTMSARINYELLSNDLGNLLNRTVP